MKNIKTISIIFISFIIMLCLSIFIIKSQNSNYYEAYIKQDTTIVKASSSSKVLIASKYLLNDEIDIPQNKLVYEDKEYNSTSYIKFPSKKVVKATSVKLSEYGEYEVIYLAKHNNIMLKDSYKFIVLNELYSAIGEKSNVYYGTHEYIPTTKGIIAKISPNESFVYNKPIDISTYTKNNKIVTINVLPNNIGIPDAQKIVIKLTDIYDENNFIALEMKKVEDNKLAWAENATYVAAYSNGQDSCGLESGSHPYTGRVVEYKGQTYTIHQNNYYGTWTGYAMTGAPRYQSQSAPFYEPQYVGEQEFSFAMDYENGLIYGGPFLSLVNDLRSDIIYGSNFWTGFTTGEVYLSISAINYNAETLNIIIKEIADVSTEEMSNNNYADNVAPTLDILWENEYPIGLVNHEYPIFDVYSYDEYEHVNKSVKTNVYLNYGLSNQIDVPIKNNCFIPKYATTYYIKYSVKDKSGNINEKVIPITIKESVNKISIKNKTTVNSTFEVGEKVDVSILEYENIIGNVKEKVTAILKNDPSVSYEVLNNCFIPLYSGEYEIKYEYSDYIFNDQYSYDISVTHSDKPVIIDEIKLEDFYIKNCKYILPTYYGYIFQNGKPKKQELEIYVTENTNTFKIENNEYIPSYNGKVTISYKLNNLSHEAKKDIYVEVIDVGYDSTLEMGKYFYSNNTTIDANSKYIEYTLINNVDTNIKFINPVPSCNFSIRFAASENKDNFTKINIYLTDTIDKNIRVKFTYEKESTGYVKFYINDKAATSYNSLFSSSEKPIILEYNDRKHQVSPHPASYQMVNESVNGEKFDGFISDKVNLEIELVGVSSDSAIRMINLCGQPITKVKADIIEPKIYVYNDVGEYELNSIYTLSAATIQDILDPNIKSSMVVKDPDGSIVTSMDNVLLDENAPYNIEHKIKLTKYGIYQVHYEASDSCGNKTTYAFIVNVVDKDAPIVTINSSTSKAKKGEIVNIAPITIKDNYSNSFEIYVCMISPTGKAYSLTAFDFDEKVLINKSFTAKESGKYQICYYVADESGNTTVASYTIVVE